MIKLNKRLLSLILTGVIMVSASACGQSQQTATPTPTGTASATPSSSPGGEGSGKLTDTPVTFTFIRPENALQPYNPDSKTIKEIEKRTGITIDVQIVPASDWGSKMNTLLATDSLPDFFRMWTDVKDVVNSGALLQLDELIDAYAPIIKSDYETIPNLDKSKVNGGIYALPTLRRDTNYEKGATPNIRVDKLEELGLSVPTTWDELYNVLKVFSEKYPDSIAWGSRGEANLLRNNTNAVKSLGADYNLYQDSDGTWKLGRMEQDFKGALTFLNKLYNEEILDNEYLITTAQDWKAGCASGKYLFYYDNPTFLDAFNKTLQETDPNARWEPIPILENSKGERQSYLFNDHTFNEYGFKADVENPELLIKLFNWLYSEEGALLMNYGVEGEEYDMVNGVPTFKQELLDKYKDSTDPQYAASSDLGIGLLFFTPAWYSHYGDQFQTSDPDSVNALFIHNVYKDKMEYMVLQPVEPPYTGEETERINKIRQNIEDYSTTEVNKFVTGQRNLSEFDAFVSELKSKGADELVQIANDAQARYEQSKK